MTQTSPLIICMTYFSLCRFYLNNYCSSSYLKLIYGWHRRCFYYILPIKMLYTYYYTVFLLTRNPSSITACPSFWKINIKFINRYWKNTELSCHLDDCMSWTQTRTWPVNATWMVKLSTRCRFLEFAMEIHTLQNYLGIKLFERSHSCCWWVHIDWTW